MATSAAASAEPIRASGAMTARDEESLLLDAPLPSLLLLVACAEPGAPLDSVTGMARDATVSPCSEIQCDKVRTRVDIRRDRVRGVVVRLHVRVTQRLVQARDDRHDVQRRVVGQCSGENVACCDIDRLCKQVVLEHDEPSVNLVGLVDNSIPVRKNLRSRDGTASNVVICRNREDDS